MTSFAISSIAVAVLNFSLGVVFAIITRWRTRAYLLWSLFCFGVSLWAVGLGLLTRGPDSLIATRFLLIHYFGAIFLLAIFYHFIQIFLNRSAHRSVAFVYLSAILLFVLALSGYLVAVRPHREFGFYTSPGPAYVLFLIYLVPTIGYTHYLLYRKYKNADRNLRSQIQLLFIATGIGFIGGVATISPVYDGPSFSWAMPLVFIYLMIFSYAIVHERLMDIELMAKQAIAKVCTLGLIALPLVVGSILVKNLATTSGTGAARMIGTLGTSVLSVSLCILALRRYQEIRARRLCGFFLLLGIWNASELLLDFPARPYSILLYRLAYAVGCCVLLAWLEYWREYFDEGHLLPVPYHRVLIWSALAMMSLSLTPFVLRSLRYDPLGQSPATEVPGILYPVFAVWFLTALALTAAWTAKAFSTFQRDVSAACRRWVLSAFGFGITAAAAYFGYVQGKILFPIHAYLEAGLCVALAQSLPARYNGGQWDQESVSPWIGATSLIYPLAAGALLTRGLALRILGGLLLVATIPDIYPEIRHSVQAWINDMFKGRFSARRAIHQTKEQVVRLTNLRDLVEISVRQAAEVLRPGHIVLYFHNLTENKYLGLLEWPEMKGMPSFFSEGDSLIRFLSSSQHCVIGRSELPKGFTAAIPLYQEMELFGFILLGDSDKLNATAGHSSRERPYTLADLEDIRQTLEHPLCYAHVFYEQSMMLNKMTHDNIRYAGNIHDFAEVYLENWGAELRDEQKECLEEIRHQSVLLQEYLKDLRRIMSILAKRMQGQYEMGVYDLRELTRQVLQAESARAQQNGVSLCLTAETENAKESCLGWGERDSVRHVIENLIGNALKFTPRGGTVSAGVKDLGDTLEFTVTDTGPGIPPESLPHIFELFYQGKGREEMSQSTGLGLSIVKEIVALHGGNIDVITEIGQGTTFFVRLPSEKARPDKRAA